MKRLRSTAAASLAALVSIGSCVTALAGGPVTKTWPGSGCPSTLQACIDGVQDGSTILVRTNSAVHEAIAIGGSIRLEGAPGFSPIIDRIAITAPTAPVEVLVADVRVRDVITADAHKGSGHEIAIRRVRIQQPAADPPDNHGIELSASVPVVFIVSRARIHVEAENGRGIELNAFPTSGRVTLRAIANRIDQVGNAHGASGIDVSGSGAGALRADVMNNVIRRVAGARGAGIEIGLHQTIDADVNVVGNTIEGSRRHGVLLVNDVEAGGSLDLNVFGNAFAFERGAGIVFDPGGLGLSFSAGHNAYFRNRQADFVEGRSLGQGNVRKDPRFVDRAGGDLRLKASSPLVDAGIVCSPGGVADPDAAGRHRLAGRSVDIGAYERDAPGVNGIVHVGDDGSETEVGTSGRDVMCGYGGSDHFEGRGGDDYLDGGPLGDSLDGGSGRDRLVGGPGDDIVCADDGSGGDHVDGGAGTDQFDADRGDVRTSVEVRLRPCVG